MRQVIESTVCKYVKFVATYNRSMKIRKAVVLSCYYDAQGALLELRPKITKRRLEELRAKTRGKSELDLSKSMMGHICACNLRHLALYQNMNTAGNLLRFLNLSTNKGKVIKQLKLLANIKI